MSCICSFHSIDPFLPISECLLMKTSSCVIFIYMCALVKCLPILDLEANFAFNRVAINVEQSWPSGNALDQDQHGPGFEAHRMPLVTSGRDPVLNAHARTKFLSKATSKPQGIGGNGGNIEYIE